MKVSIFKSLSNQRKLIEVQEGRTVAEALGKEIDVKNAIIVINGKKVKKEYILKEGDIITIREFPKGVTAAIVSLAVVGVVAGVIGGIELAKQKEAQEEMQKELDKMKKMSNQPQIDNRPFIRGASNTLATGNSQPYFIGRNFFTPYLNAPYFYNIEGTDGETQYINISLQAGFNKQVLKQINIEDIALKKFTEDTAQQGPFNFDSSIFAEGRGEVSQDGSLFTDLTESNYKHSVNFYNQRIPKDVEIEEGKEAPLTFTLNETAKDVTLSINFLSGIYAYNEDGDKIETSVSITPEYSLDGGVTFSSFTFNNNGTFTNTFTRNVSDKELRFTAHKEFNIDDYKKLYNNGQTSIVCRIKSNGNADTKIKNDCYLLYAQSVCFDSNKSEEPAGEGKKGTGLVKCLTIEDRERAYCTNIALKIKSTKANENKLKKINIITQGLARVVEGGKWTTEKKQTANLAAWVLEILTSDTHPASKIKDSEIDLESFIDLYNYCEQKNITYNYVITQNTKKKDTLEKMLTACSAVLYQDIYGKYAVSYDHPQENALQVYNAQNIISIEHQRNFNRKIDGLRIRFINGKNDLFKEDTYLLMKDDENGNPRPLTADSLIRDIRLDGVTDFEQVIKYARRLIAIEELRPKVTTIKVGNEGQLFTPLSKVLIQDDSLKIGIDSGVIRGVIYQNDRLKKLKLNKYITFEKGKKYGFIVNAYNNKACVPLPVAVTGSGTTNEVTVLSIIGPSTYPRPEAENVFTFGELNADGTFTKITSPFLIQNITRSGSDYTIELVDYNENIYKDGKIPKYRSNITELPTEPPALPPVALGERGAPGKPGKDGAPGLTILLEKPSLLYYADSEGVVKEQETRNKVQVMNYGVTVPFIIGPIESPAGMIVTSYGHDVVIKATTGATMALEGEIKVPVIFKKIKSTDTYTDGKQNIYTDNKSNEYGTYIYEKEDTIINLYITYAKSVKGKEGKEGKEGERAAKYYGVLDKAPAGENYIIGDYYIDRATARIYKVTAIPVYWSEILPSEDEALYYEHINELTSLIKDLPESDVTKKFVNVYIELLLADTAFIDALGAKRITLRNDDPSKPAYIKSNDFISEGAGFCIYGDGDAEFNRGKFNNVTVRGDIFANDGEFKGIIQGESGTLQKMKIIGTEYNAERNDYLGVYSADYQNGPTEYTGTNIKVREGGQGTGVTTEGIATREIAVWGDEKTSWIRCTNMHLQNITFGGYNDSIMLTYRSGLPALIEALTAKLKGTQQQFFYISGYVTISEPQSKGYRLEGIAQVQPEGPGMVVVWANYEILKIYKDNITLDVKDQGGLPLFRDQGWQFRIF